MVTVAYKVMKIHIVGRQLNTQLQAEKMEGG